MKMWKKLVMVAMLIVLVSLSVIGSNDNVNDTISNDTISNDVNLTSDIRYYNTTSHLTQVINLSDWLIITKKANRNINESNIKEWNILTNESILIDNTLYNISTLPVVATPTPVVAQPVAPPAQPEPVAPQPLSNNTNSSSEKNDVYVIFGVALLIIVIAILCYFVWLLLF